MLKSTYTGMLRLLAFLALSCDLVTPEVDFIAERLPLQGDRPYPGSPWPMPKFWRRDKSTLTFAPKNLRLTSDLQGCDAVDQACARFRQRLLTVDKSDVSSSDTAAAADDDDENNDTDVVGVLYKINVEVETRTCPKYPQYGHQENYTLKITSDVRLKASSVWSVLLGLETLSQLMYMSDGKWYINRGRIHDEPRFKFRGFHLDTARHFYPVPLLKTMLDIMLTNKLNVFHWHIVDAQSFPYQSIAFPQLSLKGAFSQRHVYTQENIAELIEYARLRGIRIVPELDTPGHAHSWGKAMPELLTPCWAGGQRERANYSYHAERENFDPSKNSTFHFLEAFFREIASVFKDEYLHLGMDEAHHMCWESSPEIADFMKSIGLKEGDYSGLERYYDLRLLDIVADTNKKAIIWEDPINQGNDIPKSTLIHLWKDINPLNVIPWQELTQRALRSGYDVIFSSCWYLNRIAYGQDWTKYYQCDPYDVNATEAEKSRIHGGVAATWSEYIDETNVIQVAWPRGSAVAERLWSPRHVNNTLDATFRIDQHRCRLIRQGFLAGPVLPGFCKEDYNTDNSIIGKKQHLRTRGTTKFVSTSGRHNLQTTPAVSTISTSDPQNFQTTPPGSTISTSDPQNSETTPNGSPSLRLNGFSELLSLFLATSWLLNVNH